MIATSKYVFHVVGGKEVDKEKDTVVTTTIHGSCFYLGKNFFLTAKHVIENARDSKRQAIGFLKKGLYQYREFEKIETFDDIDLGIIQVDCSEFKLSKFKWTATPRHMLDLVYTFGFPFGFVKGEEKDLITSRAFMGHIVNRSTIKPFYELSFNCPRGLSGAPLLTRSGDKIVGIIVGNSVTKINVYRVEEKEVAEGNTNTYTQDETVYFGQAIQSNIILKGESKLLGTSIEKFLSMT